MRFWKVPTFAVLISLLGPHSAHAITMLKQVQFQRGDEIKLSFESEVQAPQVAIEYLTDIVQISIRDVGIYPAKMTSTSGSFVTKIFAYQYSPKLVRVRLSIKGKAMDFKDRVQLKYAGKMVSIKVEKPISQEQRQSDTQELKSSEALADINEEELSKKIIKDTSAKAQLVEAREKSQGLRKNSITNESHSESKPTVKPMTSMWMVFAKLGLVLILFGLVLFGIKWGRGSAFLKKFQLGNLLESFANNQPVKEKTGIQIISRCYIDQRKSLIVARVGNKQYFLGVTPDAIGFLADVSGRDLEASQSAPSKSNLASESAQSAQFSELFEDEMNLPRAPGKSSVSSDVLNQGVRSRIRSRLEGLKPL